LNYRRATLNDCSLLAELNHQLIRDEGHRNKMTVPELEQRMRGWLTGVIYAPSASATINAGPVTSMVGSLMVHSLTLNGHFTFHFDEHLLHTSSFP
jgi:hypothetical protein